MDSKSPRPDKNSNPPQDEKPASSSSGQHKLDLGQTLSTSDAAQQIASGRRTMAEYGTRSRLPLPQPASQRGAEAKPSPEIPMPSASKKEKDPVKDRDSLLDAGKDAQKGMDAFTHYADTITDSLFFIIGSFEKAVGRINLGVGLLFLVVFGLSVLLYRFENAVSAQQEDRKRNEALYTELRTLKNDLMALKTKAEDTQASVEQVQKRADEKTDIDIEVDEKTGAAKVVIQPKSVDLVPPVVSRSSSSSAKRARKSSSGSSDPLAALPAPAPAPAPAPQAIEIPLSLPGARMVPSAASKKK